MFAVIEFKKSQYKVAPGEIISLPNFVFDQKDKKVVFDKVLLVNNDKEILIGQPEVKGASVSAEIIEKARTEKIRVFKFRAKKRYKRTAGQRQNIVKVKIDKINLK